MVFYKKIITVILFAVIAAATGFAKDFNDKVLNRPYADFRTWHLGFSFGLHAQMLNITHNGFTTEDGETWYMDQPDYSPGFCVNGLFDLRLNKYFNLRVTPGMYFGNRVIKMRDTSSEQTLQQNVKSAFVVMPIDIKYSALRYRNARPYITAGVMPAFDVTKKNNDYLKLKPTDVYLTCGLGCDFYLPYFKLIPELKFCFGLTDVIDHERKDLTDDPSKLKITQSIKKATSAMVVLTFYFE